MSSEEKIRGNVFHTGPRQGHLGRNREKFTEKTTIEQKSKEIHTVE